VSRYALQQPCLGPLVLSDLHAESVTPTVEATYDRK
jgi:hypothetical protein